MMFVLELHAFVLIYTKHLLSLNNSVDLFKPEIKRNPLYSNLGAFTVVCGS